MEFSIHMGVLYFMSTQTTTISMFVTVVFVWETDLGPDINSELSTAP